jgi:hypothetical protein
VAPGGIGCAVNTTSGAAAPSGGTGDTLAYGGRGGNVNGTTNTGPGGGAAGPGGNGTQGSDSATTGGAAASGNPATGTGGNGRTTSGIGNAGATYGGGGGGSWRTTADRVGSNGAAGYARIYFPPVSGMTLCGCG